MLHFEVKNFELEHTQKIIFLTIFSLSFLPCGHQVVEVEDFDEGLDLGPLLHLLLAHALGDDAWVPVDTCHQGVAILFVLGAIIVVLQETIHYF